MSNQFKCLTSGRCIVDNTYKIDHLNIFKLKRSEHLVLFDGYFGRVIP